MAAANQRGYVIFFDFGTIRSDIWDMTDWSKQKELDHIKEGVALKDSVLWKLLAPARILNFSNAYGSCFIVIDWNWKRSFSDKCLVNMDHSNKNLVQIYSLKLKIESEITKHELIHEVKRNFALIIRCRNELQFMIDFFPDRKFIATNSIEEKKF
ncbi:unnamed protein product [Rhizophagus irregularis]|uniref:Uncharacterized protein n=1 Tax=Rhizophagus irregularis TaxID=588596 RepID=A0A2I1G0V2_9GLOM|nr:hypothetical protein RhiirA4_453593 [Rhizophagus irregularis]CAB4436798.1 unnamed protein product [Rhizophagus irregularis]